MFRLDFREFECRDYASETERNGRQKNQHECEQQKIVMGEQSETSFHSKPSRTLRVGQNKNSEFVLRINKTVLNAILIVQS